MSRVGEKIKALRIEAAMSQKQLGKKLGVAENFVNEIEMGKRVINEALINRISKVFGKDINDLNMHSEDSKNEEIEERKVVATAPVKKTKIKEEEPNEVWSNALSSILKSVPIYTYNLNKALDLRQLPVVGNKIEGHAQDKVFFIKIENDDMIGFRIGKEDIAFCHAISEIANNSICLIEYNNERVVRQIKRLDNTKVLLVSNSGSVRTETANIKEIKTLAKLDRVEIIL